MKAKEKIEKEGETIVGSVSDPATVSREITSPGNDLQPDVLLDFPAKPACIFIMDEIDHNRINPGYAMQRGMLLVLSGPSGTGKTSLAWTLLDRRREQGMQLKRSVSITTRPPRPGEVDGDDYQFVSEDQFAELAARERFLEQAEVYGYRYGTPRLFVENCLADGVDVLLVLDPNGRQQLARTHLADLVSVFLLPPDSQELERRLLHRNPEQPDHLVRRLNATQQEVAHCEQYDYLLVNDDFNATLASLEAILHVERLRRSWPSQADPKLFRQRNWIRSPILSA